MLTIVVGSKGYLGQSLPPPLKELTLLLEGWLEKIEYDSYEYLSTEIFKGLEGSNNKHHLLCARFEQSL